MTIAAATPVPAVPGDVLAGYQLLEEIGRGGMARVFEARHVHPGRDRLVAIKVIHPEWSGDDLARERFCAESQLAVSVRHPCLVRTIEAGVEDGRMFIVMERVRGANLAELLRRAGEVSTTLPGPVNLYVIGEVLKGLAHLHELADGEGTSLDAVHHDVTPANVLLSDAGDVKLGDFGVASLAMTRRALSPDLMAGKAGYFAPEQLVGGKVDQRADIFAAGVLAYELLMGRRLFCGPNEFDDNERARLPRLDLPPPLAAILRRALARQPRRRYRCARELLAALAGHLPPPAEGRAMLRQVLERLMPTPKWRQEDHGARVGDPIRARPRVLLVGPAAARLRQELDRWGATADVAATSGEAVALAARRTFRALAVDATGRLDADPTQLGAWYRGLPGMGHQPVVYLGDRLGADAWRTSWLPAGASPSAAAGHLRGMLDRMGNERSFARYPMRSPMLLSVNGRPHSVESVDISRNGTAVVGPAIPALRLEVTLEGALHHPWRARGLVRRVTVESAGVALVGIELIDMSEACEADLIATIACLAAP